MKKFHLYIGNMEVSIRKEIEKTSEFIQQKSPNEQICHATYMGERRGKERTARQATVTSSHWFIIMKERN